MQDIIFQVTRFLLLVIKDEKVHRYLLLRIYEKLVEIDCDRTETLVQRDNCTVMPVIVSRASKTTERVGVVLASLRLPPTCWCLFGYVL